MRISLSLNICKTIVLNSVVCLAASMRAVQIKEYGGPQNLYVDSNIPVPELSSPDHILIKVAATALNRADTLQRKGSYAPPKGESDILGLEASGIVDDVGENVKEFKAGDKVMALLGGGGYAEFVSVHQHQVMRVPDNVDLVMAAGIPEVWLTAYQLLHFVAKINPGDKVLIHAAGSGVGTAAIQLTKAIADTYVIGTAGTVEKLNKARELGADVTVNYKEENFAEVVTKVTDGLGVDVILDPIGASNLEKNTKSIGIDGRWVLYGLMGGAKVDGPFLASLLRKRVQLLSSTLRARSIPYKKELVDAFISDASEKFSNRQFQPIIDSVTNLDGVAEAHQRMDANLNAGKIIMKVANAVARDDL